MERSLTGTRVERVRESVSARHGKPRLAVGARSRGVWPLGAVLLLAAILRLAFWNGPFGSDDLVYLSRAVEAAQGIWTSSTYNGALRYGFNVPVGVFIRLFGVSELSANIWPFICSLAEIAVVFFFARSVWGTQPAVFASALLAVTPIHVASATRILPDPVVSLFLTASFVLFFRAERVERRASYFWTGIAMGGVFWVKELAAVALFAFVFYPIVTRRWSWRWHYVVLGGLVMLAAHLALMWAIAGDPFHVFKVVRGQVTPFLHTGQGRDDLTYYLWYLFVDVRHTWLVGPLAAAGAFIALRQARFAPTAHSARYVVFWLASLLAVLSLTPVSLEPLRFVLKQPNYITLFLAPLALLAGHSVWKLGRPGAYLLAATLAGCVVLGALEQQAYRVFVSNSKAAVEFAREHPDRNILASTNNSNLAQVYSILYGEPELRARFGYLDDVPRTGDVAGSLPTNASAETYAIIDRETTAWGRGAIAMADAPPCWKHVQRLKPIGFGLGASVLDGLIIAAKPMPDIIGARLARALERLVTPQPADVYIANAHDLWCRSTQ